MAGEASRSLRALYRLTYPDGSTYRYWCHAELDPQGVDDVLDTERNPSGVSVFWEPRVVSGGDRFVEDVGGLLEGLPKASNQTITVLLNLDGRGGMSGLLGDMLTNRIDGATLDVWVGNATLGTTAGLTRIWTGVVPISGVDFDLAIGGAETARIAAQQGTEFDLALNTERFKVDDFANMPAALDEAVKPIAFGPPSGGSVGSFWCYAHLLDITTPSAEVFRLGDGTPNTITGWGDPQQVVVDGTTVTAASPITSAPSPDEWGSWSASTTQFVINDTSFSISNDSIVRVKVRGCDRSSGTRPADNGEVLETVFIAANLSAKLSGVSSWNSDLPSGYEAHGVFPSDRTTTPVSLRDCLHELMISSASMMIRREGTFQPIYWPGITTADYTVYEDEVIDFRMYLDPWSEYANNVDFPYFQPGNAAFVRLPFSVVNVPEQNATGLTVTREYPVRWRPDSATVSALGNALAGQQRVAKVVCGPRLVGVRPGDGIEYSYPNIGSQLGVGHVRRVETDVAAGVVTIWSWHGD